MVARLIYSFFQRRAEESLENKWDSGRYNNSSDISADLAAVVNEARAYREGQKGQGRSREFGETLTILLLCIAGAIGYLQWETLEKTDDTLKQTLRANTVEQKSYVFRVGYKLTPLTNEGKITRWRITPILENGGNIPTSSFRIYLDYCRRGFEFDGKPVECPESFPKIMERHGKDDFHPRVLGPRQRSADEAGEIWTPTPDEIRSLPKQRMFVWGLIKYRDEFSANGTPDRETRFCNGLIFEGSPDDKQMTYFPVPTHSGNCLDSECRRQDSEPQRGQECQENEK
jgi:hypothetical protein